jgi:hypothetical protein
MAHQIWKFTISFDGEIRMPVGSRPLSVQMQNGQPVLWAIVDIANDKAIARFHVAGTGHDLPDNIGRFIDTFQMEDGALVFHVFELQS